jgi:hypothetical protein
MIAQAGDCHVRGVIATFQGIRPEVSAEQAVTGSTLAMITQA